MRTRSLAPILLLLLAAATAGADDEAPPAPLRFDAENLAISEVLEKAKKAEKPVFIDFYAPG